MSPGLQVVVAGQRLGPGVAGAWWPRAPSGAAVQMFQTLAATQHCRAPRPCPRNKPQEARSLTSQGQPPPLHIHIHSLPQQQL